MIKENIAKAICDQANAEYYSAYLYQAMGAWADREGFKGVANWLFVQAREELEHGVKLFRHLLERGASPAFAEIKAPPSSWGSVKELFEKVLAHERGVSAAINKIADLAKNENDHATYGFIAWYVSEQVEEEANAEDLVSKFTMVGDNKGLILSLDSALAARK
jgi:ferritin